MSETAQEKQRRKWREGNKKYKSTARGKYMAKFSSKNRISKMRAISRDSDINASYLRYLYESTTHCVICGCKMTEEPNHTNCKSMDHILPLSLGGLHMINNVRYICRLCNNKRPRTLDGVKREIGT